MIEFMIEHILSKLELRAEVLVLVLKIQTFLNMNYNALLIKVDLIK